MDHKTKALTGLTMTLGLTIGGLAYHIGKGNTRLLINRDSPAPVQTQTISYESRQQKDQTNLESLSIEYPLHQVSNGIDYCYCKTQKCYGKQGWKYTTSHLSQTATIESKIKTE